MIITKQCQMVIGTDDSTNQPILCNKTLEVYDEYTFDSQRVVTYKCGHKEIFSIKNLSYSDINITSEDGKQPFPFQLDGALQAIKSNLRVCILDDPGLGKTVQSLMALKAYHKQCLDNNTPELSPIPALFIVKAKLKIQWMREIHRWCGWISQIIEDENWLVIPGLNAYIVSGHSLAYQSFTRKNKAGVEKTVEKGFKDLPAWIQKNKIKSIVLDEAQIIKNHEAKITNAVRKAVKETSYFIGLSGTPIKNNANEYFPLLNLVRPDKFPSLQNYKNRWVKNYWDGYKLKPGGLQDPEGFKQYTSQFIIRRTREEVLPELADIGPLRNPQFSELGKAVESAYKAELEQFSDYYSTTTDSGMSKQSNILAYMQRMRHLTGISKIDSVVEFVSEFMMTTDRKYIVFTHHNDVRKILIDKLEQERALYGFDSEEVLELKSGMSDVEIGNLTDKFWGDKHRLLVASTLAAGEGFNFQCCSDIGIMERQWNPANEEQVEGRVLRIGQTADLITATYFIAVGTIDEFFAELVEKKRAIMKNTLDGMEITWNENSLVSELAELLASKGAKKWVL
jgi:SNF2 family DNA or RNA helicase